MSTVASRFCPPGSSDAQSTDPADHGGFGNPDTPEYESQKNLTRVAYDPRNNTLIGAQGGWGTFGESPATNPRIIRSTDCAQTWQEMTNLVEDEGIGPYDTGYEEGTGSNLTDLTWQPAMITRGLNPGEWLWFDYFGGYYFSSDNGQSWSGRRMSSSIETGIIPVGENWEEYHHVFGHTFDFDTRQRNVHHYIEAGTIGYSYGTERANEEDGWYNIGIRRSLAPNGGAGFGDWGDSLHPAESNWTNCMGTQLHGANGRWIAILGEYAPWRSDDPQMRINTSTNLDPNSWGSARWLIDEDFANDYYGGSEFGPNNDGMRMISPGNQNAHGYLKFIPNSSQPAGGRWWFMGLNNFLLFSDDNGETWDKSFMNHPGPQEAIHPMLSWRAQDDLGYRFTPPRVLDILQNPITPSMLMAVGTTYDREGITNRLAVFCCSEDGGDTWGPVGQIPISLNNITSSDSGPGADAPATARYAFPCMGGVL
jgi:hypothetical protein